MRLSGLFVSLVFVAALSSPLAAQTSPTPPQPDHTGTVPTVKETVVVAATPVPGGETPTDNVPAPVQTAGAAEIDKSGSLDLSDFLNRRLASVHVNETQGNPFQPDVNFRGYTASPLLGTPQGISLFMDGVRLNQPFGQIVSWDLVPQMAIRSLTFMPGSNPVFGLNTLGGALALETKTGLSAPGTTIQGVYGSNARKSAEFEHGGSRASGLHWYVSGNIFDDHGWRDDSPSTVRQIFGKLGQHRDRSDVFVSVSHADNRLTGNGLQSTEFLETDRTSVYTKPDQTDNRATLVNLVGARRLGRAWSVSGNAFYRRIRTNTLNGDINEDSLDQAIYQPNAAERTALAAAGYTGVPASGANADNTPFPSWRCIANVLLEDEPGEKCNGLINRGSTRQYSAGANGQAILRTSHSARTNQLTIGAAFEHSHATLLQSMELGYLNPDRSVTGLGVFADGEHAGNVDGEPLDARVDLDGSMRTGSVYAADTFSPTPRWHLTVSGRYDRSSLTNVDGINPGGGLGSLDGRHTFSRLNPAAGITFSPNPPVNVYAGYAEGSRAPASVELGCANPERPCKLPNAMAGDPPLDQVIARTFEAGVRSGSDRALAWHVGWFRASNRDDILFVASEQTGFGYFTNFGSTRRQGLELSVDTQRGRVAFGGSYTYLDATFESAETVNGTGNSSNDEAEAGLPGVEGSIEITPGDRMPLVPRHVAKAYADLAVTARVSIDVDVLGTSSAFARGNENNRHEPDDVFYLGNGSTEGYVVANLSVRYQLRREIEILAQLNNLFDAEYSTASQLGPTGFTNAGAFIARPFPAVGGDFPVRHTTFEAPGAPRTFWVGLRIRP